MRRPRARRLGLRAPPPLWPGTAALSSRMDEGLTSTESPPALTCRPSVDQMMSKPCFSKIVCESRRCRKIVCEGCSMPVNQHVLGAAAARACPFLIEDGSTTGGRGDERTKNRTSVIPATAHALIVPAIEKAPSARTRISPEDSPRSGSLRFRSRGT
ncbi:hypothetical protein CEXT_351471 [Caerostris extrusa]|uniref:Uncharacterized protein n=1 Tax=Caerostris extrusa TaxID=172846 RepID=A0AAV4RL49_CAEEX|nr:hypothetical protein CEXT_351471 [Caerostris extrusa]